MRLDDQPEAENDANKHSGSPKDQHNGARKPARNQRNNANKAEAPEPMGALGAALLKARGGK